MAVNIPATQINRSNFTRLVERILLNTGLQPQNFELEVTGGIETVEQLDFLLQQGCEQGQGFLYSKPLAADDFKQWAPGNLQE